MWGVGFGRFDNADWELYKVVTGEGEGGGAGEGEGESEVR